MQGLTGDAVPADQSNVLPWFSTHLGQGHWHSWVRAQGSAEQRMCDRRHRCRQKNGAQHLPLGTNALIPLPPLPETCDTLSL